MSIENLQSYFRDRGCLPHQFEFAAKFLALDSARKHMLVSLPGLGKGFVGSAIAGYAATHGAGSRVLVLAPPALVPQWRYMIEQSNPDAQTVIVDRRKFRELDYCRDENSSIWPHAAIVLMSTDFARQPDVAESLLGAEWELLIVDESHRLKQGSQRYQVVADLIERSPTMRVLFLQVKTTAIESWSEYLADPLFSNIDVSIWSRQTVRDQDGRPLLPELQLHWVPYRRRKDEIQILSQLQELLPSHISGDERSLSAATAIMGSAASSLFALEQKLGRICRQRNNSAHGRDNGPDGIDPDAEELFPVIESSNATSIQSQLSDKAAQLQETLDEIESESKFESLLSLLHTLDVFRNRGCRACIFTHYVDTATYLESTLSEHHPRVLTLSESILYGDREQIVADFTNNGGILIATDAVSMRLPDVDAVVFYDLPLDPETVETRIGQFVRVGRTAPVRIFAFVDESETLFIERLQRKIAEVSESLNSEPFESLGTLLKTHVKDQPQSLLFPDIET